MRNNIAGKHADYFKKVMPHVDKILECRWQQCRKENVDADEFWSLFRGPLSLIVKPEDWDVLVSATGAWSDHEDLLSRTCRATTIGRSVWSWALPKVIEAKIARTISDGVAALEKLVLDQKQVQSTMASIVTKIMGFADLDTLPARRHVEISYRKTALMVTVTSYKKQVELAVGAHVKERAVMLGLVKPVLLEEILIGEVKMESQHLPKIDEALVAPTRILRQKLEELIPEQARSSVDILVQLVGAKETSLLAIDACAAIEISLLTSANTFAGATKLQVAMLACLPEAGEARTIAEALARVNVVLHGELYKICPAVTQSAARSCKEALTFLQQGRCPPTSGQAATPMVKQFLDKVIKLPSCAGVQGQEVVWRARSEGVL